MSRKKLLNAVLLVLFGLLAFVKTIGGMERPPKSSDEDDLWDIF